MSARVTVEGLPELRRALRRFQGDVADLKAANTQVAATVAAAGATLAPRRTGRLSGSVRGNRAAGRATVTVPRVRYAAPIHYGWPARNIEGQPFLIDAAQQTESVWLPAYERAVQTAADKVGG